MGQTHFDFLTRRPGPRGRVEDEGILGAINVESGRSGGRLIIGNGNVMPLFVGNGGGRFGMVGVVPDLDQESPSMSWTNSRPLPPLSWS